jgi:cytochrome c oxidase cbb3-type subunit I/II
MSRQTVRYDDAIVRKFVTATIVWGAVGMVVGLWCALQLAMPRLNFAPYFTFGRLRPLHTNAVIFAFAGNAIFAAVYYSSQRLLKARPLDRLSAIHFWGWQAIIVAAAITLPLGFTQGKEYAELEWPIDVAIAVVWVTFAVNFFAMVRNRREKHLYVALWFYIASIVTIAILHIFNNLVIPAGLFKSYSVYAGVEDAFMQWWYGHNAVAFVLTTPFLGLMYYFLPKAAERPVFSYRLSILHFWSLVFIYIWAGPHHLHYTALPAWASTPRRLSAASTALPEINDISRSLESPPSSTAVLPNSAARVTRGNCVLVCNRLMTGPRRCALRSRVRCREPGRRCAAHARSAPRPRPQARAHD